MNPESAAMFQNAAYLIISLLVVGTIYTVVAPFFEKDQLKVPDEISIIGARSTQSSTV